MANRIFFIYPTVGPSLNEFYAGMHVMKRRKTANFWHAAVDACCRQQGIQEYTGPYPVHVDVRCYFGPGERRLDVDNLASTAKLIIDGLRHAGKLKGDSPVFISAITLRSCKSREKGLKTVVEITPALSDEPADESEPWQDTED